MVDYGSQRTLRRGPHPDMPLTCTDALRARPGYLTERDPDTPAVGVIDFSPQMRPNVVR